MKYDFKGMVSDFNKYLRLPETPVGIKYFEKKEDCQSIERIKCPKGKYTFCQILWQSISYGWTLMYTSDLAPMKYCAQVNGLYPRDEKFFTGEIFMGGWFNEPENARAHHEQLDLMDKVYEAAAISPLEAGKIEEPDICIIHGNTAQIFMLMSGYLNIHYEKLPLTFGGETECSNSWVRAMVTGKPMIAVPSFAERKFGGAKDYELVCAMSPDQLMTAIEGLKRLHKNGLRYPIAHHGQTCDASTGLPKSYFDF